MIIQCPTDEARAARRWSAHSAGPAGVTAAGALWALKEKQPGDVPQTWTDVSKAEKLFGYDQSTTFKNGVEQFYNWNKQQSKDGHVVLILTEWDEFKALDYQRIYAKMQQPAFLFDGRNLLDLEELREIGFEASGIGQG